MKHSKLKIIGLIGMCAIVFGILPLKFFVDFDFETSLIVIPILGLFGILIMMGVMNESCI